MDYRAEAIQVKAQLERALLLTIDVIDKAVLQEGIARMQIYCDEYPESVIQVESPRREDRLLMCSKCGLMRKKGYRLPHEKSVQIKECLKSGISLNVIATKVHVSRNTVRRIDREIRYGQESQSYCECKKQRTPKNTLTALAMSVTRQYDLLGLS